MNTINTVTAATVLALGGPALASVVVFEVTGRITDAQNLVFAVVGGNPVAQGPLPGDLPLNFTGELVVDNLADLITFQFEGSFVSPDRSYAFNISTPNLAGGLTFLDLNGGVGIQDVYDDFDFQLSIGAATGRGSFSFLSPGGVPSSPAQDVFATGVIDTVTVVPTPGAAALLGVGLSLAGIRRRA